jgi:hypothetical protein
LQRQEKLIKIRGKKMAWRIWCGGGDVMNARERGCTPHFNAAMRWTREMRVMRDACARSACVRKRYTCVTTTIYTLSQHRYV